MPELLDLSDNCLERVFDYCDAPAIVSLSKVCTRFNALVTSNHFPKQTKFVAYFGINEEECIELFDMLGQYLIQLDIHDTSNTLEFYRAIARSVGQQLRKLTIYRVLGMSEELLQTLAPTLQCLEELKLNVMEDCSDALELRARCSNLRRLDMQWNTKFMNTEHWPRLEEFVLDNELVDGKQFREFLENNRQLQKLKIGCLNYDLQLSEILQYMVNLNELVVFQNYSDLSPDSILALQQLPQLKRLVLKNILSDFEEIATNATKLSGLVDLQLHADCDSGVVDCIAASVDDDDNEDETCTNYEYYDLNPQCLIGIAHEMPQLQVFGISNCKLKNETVLEFIQSAENLREIHIHCTDFKLTTDAVIAIANARGENAKQNGPLIFYTWLNDEKLRVRIVCVYVCVCGRNSIFVRRFLCLFFQTFSFFSRFKWPRPGTIFK